ncbi:macrocin-O-methyltransferase TylF [Hoeflea marina]|uniref:Macrocin-O-methyltransferase TylF n=1 Tax=Hoeflea marina TaxID=274592 RepID=A0A317PNA7_9HYPH|nr:class I SAM-dependent methyltransferase [Hoeflea marina]PWW01548.1 macrocin-O-methyltransferase TylF [Hoeflea marina]
MPERDGLLFKRDFNPDERIGREKMIELMASSPIPADERPENAALYTDHMQIGKILFLDLLYRQIVTVPGVIMEFGCRWGQNLATFANLRALYEPTNGLRKIYGFDTFSGFVDSAPEDLNTGYDLPGAVATTPGYESHLAEVMRANELTKPLSHKVKFDIIKGDARQTVPAFLKQRPQTIISLAYLDMDLYSPTRVVLEEIAPFLTRGSIVVLDELNDEAFPGETLAVRDTLGLGNIALRRVPYLTHPSYFVVE